MFPTFARLVQHVLATHGLGTAIEVTSGREALASLHGIDIVLLDHQLPDSSGLDVLEAIRGEEVTAALGQLP